MNNLEGGLPNQQTIPVPPPKTTPTQPGAQPSIDLKNLIEALSKIKTGSFIMIIAFLLITVSLITMIPLLLPYAMFIPTLKSEWSLEEEYSSPPISISYGLLITIALLIIGAILVLIAIYIGIVPGTTTLSKLYHQFRTASKLIELGYTWGFGLVVVGALIMFTIIRGFLLLFMFGVLITAIGVILIFVGDIGLITLCFRMNDVFKVSLFIAPGLLFIVGLFLIVADFTAWILLYVALTDTIHELRMQIKSTI